MADIHHNLEAIKDVAISYAIEHQVNYNIILMNPDAQGNFTTGSTYEFVRDSYFEKERPFAKLLHKTDDLLKDGKNEDVEEWAKNEEDRTKARRDDIRASAEDLDHPYINPQSTVNYKGLAAGKYFDVPQIKQSVDPLSRKRGSGKRRYK